MYPHRIRLHGPWEFEPVSRTVVHADGSIQQAAGSLPPPGRMKIPATWLATPLHGFRGRVRWRRRFHAPRTMEPHEQIWVAFDGVDYVADVSLNGTSLGRHEGYFEPFTFDLTTLIRDNNELIVQVDCPAELDPTCPWMLRGGLELLAPDFVGGLWRGVALEIRSFASLRDVAVRTTLQGAIGRVCVEGMVLGPTEAPVELDLDINGVCVSQQRLHVSPNGTPFTMRAAVDHVKPWWPRGLGNAALYDVRLQLHGAARTLDSVYWPVGFRAITLDSSASVATINGRVLPVRLLELDSSADPLFSNVRSFSGHFTGPIESGAVEIYRVPGRVIAPHAYDWADSHGLTLAQDFPWNACATPRAEQGQVDRLEVEREIVRQAKAMVRLLSHHPSIAWWNCSSNGTHTRDGLAGIVRSAIEHSDPERSCRQACA